MKKLTFATAAACVLLSLQAPNAAAREWSESTSCYGDCGRQGTERTLSGHPRCFKYVRKANILRDKYEATGRYGYLKRHHRAMDKFRHCNTKFRRRAEHRAYKRERRARRAERRARYHAWKRAQRARHRAYKRARRAEHRAYKRARRAERRERRARRRAYKRARRAEHRAWKRAQRARRRAYKRAHRWDR